MWDKKAIAVKSPKGNDREIKTKIEIKKINV